MMRPMTPTGHKGHIGHPDDNPKADRPLRVCMVTSALPLGGAEQLQLSVLSGLAPLGFECQVLCLREEGQSAPRFRDSGIPVTVSPRSGWRQVGTLPWLARWLRRHRIDLVLATTHVPSLHFTLLAARLAGVRATVLGLHQTGGRSIGIPSLPLHSVNLLWLLDALVLLSPNQLDYIGREERFGSRRWRRAPVAIIPNGAHVHAEPTEDDRRSARTALGLDQHRPLVGCVAAFRPEKDHATLLRAFARVAPAHPEALLVLVGSGPQESAIRTTARELGIESRVHFTGFRTDVGVILPGLDVFCLTSIQETYPVSVLEAMAAGLPVVMTRTDGVPDLVAENDTGWTVPVGDDQQIAAHLDELLADPARRVAMGAAGRRRAARHFSFDITISRYAALFRHLLNAPADGRGLPSVHRRTRTAGTSGPDA